jgi:hypothetical protein
MTIELGLFPGLMIGVRHFEPTEVYPVYEFQIFFLCFYISIMSKPVDSE